MHYFHNHLVVLASVLRKRRLKKGRQLFSRKKVHPEKILATPMNLPTPGKNPAGAHDCIKLYDHHYSHRQHSSRLIDYVNDNSGFMFKRNNKQFA